MQEDPEIMARHWESALYDGDRQIGHAMAQHHRRQLAFYAAKDWDAVFEGLKLVLSRQYERRRKF